MPQPENVCAAISAWTEILGSDAVATDDATLDRYARSTQPEGTRPCCVLFPRTAEQVQRLVQEASKHAVVVYPISRGKNWGYGDACAPEDGAAIVDLSAMNHVIEVDGELGYAVIEPGVTQQQLYEEVCRRAPQFWVDCTGAGAASSIVGNVMARGFGHTPYGDHVRTTCGMDVVLADGRLLKTGFGHYAGARAAWVYPYGVGPILDGLFMQSNLGIVTKLGVWLYPRPEGFRFFYIKVDREDALGPLVDALRPLRMKGILNSAVHIGNDLRIISSLRRYPWDMTGGATPLPDSVRAALRRESGVGAWNVSGSLAGSRAQVRGASKAIRKAVAGIGKAVFVDDARLALGQRVSGLLQRVGLGAVLARQIEALIPNYGLLKGIPTDAPLTGTQWRLRNAPATPTTDPLDAGCGVLWMSPVLPMRGKDAEELLRLVAPVFARHGFELLVTFTMLNERAMVGILNVAFDKSVGEETAAASACYGEVMTAIIRAGFMPYRVGPWGMRKLVTAGDTFWEVAQSIKGALDPADVIARGQYIPALKPTGAAPAISETSDLARS